ncbi:MAG: TerC family protein [Deltaproteobacteria bacterium]|nr:TerC family protein [Deltaproteobacteria bacterium]
MEIVLGIDNIVFIAILTGRLPKERQGTARRLGLALAMITRLGLLFAISWLMSLTAPLFTLVRTFSGRDLILLFGGAFLIAKATREIHHKLELPEPGDQSAGARFSAFGMVLLQIAVLDLVFSLDSVITAVGMADNLLIMATAMVLAVGVMLIFSGGVADFVDRHPTMKILALSFLILIGVMLLVEGLGQHVSKGYIYFAMAFSFAVELVNMRLRKAESLRLNPELEVTGIKAEPPESGQKA